MFNANRIDTDQTPRSAASDLGLHCPFYGTLGLIGQNRNFIDLCLQRSLSLITDIYMYIA